MANVFVGLSGGVDSAVSAALLQRDGHNVTGVFIKIWSPEFIECTWKEDRLDAMRVCAALDIPFREIDLSDKYKHEVVDSMVADYARGITPNPDVLCNEKIKFGSFAQWAFENGADMIATGHYACVRPRRSNMFDLRGRTCILCRGVDTAKDQSYFLYRTSTDVLARTMFPIGGFGKREVRALARRFDLPVAEKPDSQGLCFVGEVSMRDFLARFIPIERGDVKNSEGKTIGEHDGAALYTLGQRHGFRVDASTHKSTPYYVRSIDTKNNVIHVSARREDATVRSVALRDLHWIGDPPELPFSAQVQMRYHETPVMAQFSLRNGEMRVEFDEPHIASPGQSLVAYRDDVCLGGGIIEGVDS